MKQWKFSRLKFQKHAPKNIQKLLSSHLDVLDGREVDFKGDNFGRISEYEADGERFYLYPVAKDWCDENE